MLHQYEFRKDIDFTKACGDIKNMQPILFTDRLWCSSSVTVRSSGGALPGAGNSSPHISPEAHELKQPAIGLETPEKDVLRVASYNVENLFDAIDDPVKRDEGTPPKSHEDMLKLANALRSADADVVSLQEVENIEILNEFLDTYLPDLYPYRVLVEGNDIRGIDVAVISKHPITGAVSHKDDRIPMEDGSTTRFRRDFLRADIMVRGMPFSVYSTHFKAQSGGQRADDVRLAEAKEARRIIERDAAMFPNRRYVVTGDFNDVPSSDVGSVFLGGDDPFLNSALESETNKITHPVTYRTIDYLLYPDHMKDSFAGGGIQRLPDNERGSDHYLIYGDFRLDSSDDTTVSSDYAMGCAAYQVPLCTVGRAEGGAVNQMPPHMTDNSTKCTTVQPMFGMAGDSANDDAWLLRSDSRELSYLFC